ncbi:MAG TPA: HEAT repeat domain-containing protein [Candidatus Latescibacteria bacterium]|jgi:tetratricopeptide (TPR) repeat protein|nr:hypothetical protein [Gemmatimonadaceae bacterium]MDP6019298.1 HEAT repeat domain-containing protein [Candidatus Latescibacterota bacterium]HJP31842.1 HEAT repeat domain-containing protein [Candidatus Latescibacterota bacterium]
MASHRTRAAHHAVWCITLVLAACGPSAQDLVEDLADPETREAARQGLLLAKDRSVGPLLEALENPDHTEARFELAEALISLMARVDDKRIPETLNRLLVESDDARIRARIAQRMGMFKRAEAIEALLQTLKDRNGAVRYETLMALGELEAKLSNEQKTALREQARSMVADDHGGARQEAQVRVESFVNGWLNEANTLALNAQLAEADSLFHHALAYFSQSKHAAYQLGRFYFDNGQPEKGRDVLRRNGMLLDVPRLSQTPKIDGRLSDAVWEQAARADSTYKFFWGENFAATRSEVQSSFRVGYTAEALFIGFVGYDDHPDSLVTKVTEIDNTQDGDLRSSGVSQASDQIWSDDCIELFFDANLDHSSYAHFGINSLGVREDEWMPADRRNRPYDPQARWGWAGDVEIAAHVDEDFWSVEFRFNFG